MTTDERKWSYFFERHSIDEVRSWNKRLKYFRYFRAYGGHANDRDSLDVAISHRGGKDLLAVLEQIGIRPKNHSSAPPQPEVGVRYPHTEYEKFLSLIPNTRWIEQPGHTEIAGLQVFVWCYDDRIVISPKNDSWEIDDAVVKVAEAIEPHLTGISDRLIDPPKDTEHYLCVSNHPELGSEQVVPPKSDRAGG